MGKKGALFIPFCIEGSQSNVYGSCVVHDANENNLRIHLPRKTTTVCANCNRMLIDWNKKRGRCITDTVYSDTKHSILGSLNKSCYVDPGPKIEINGENYRQYKILSYEESEVKRKKNAPLKKSIKNSNNLPLTPNSEGYGSSLESPQSFDQPDGEIRSLKTPNSEGYGSSIESPLSTDQLDSEIGSPLTPHTVGYGSSIESPLSTDQPDSGLRSKNYNCSDYESGIDSPMPFVGLNPSFNGNFGELNCDHNDLALLNQQWGISGTTHDANMFNVPFIQDCGTLNSLTERNNEDEPMIQELETSHNSPSYQELCSFNNITCQVVMHDKSISQPFTINGSFPETIIQNESADQGCEIFKGNFQNGVEGYAIPNIAFAANTDMGTNDQQFMMLTNASDIPPTSDKLFPELDVSDSDWGESNVSDACWDSKLNELMSSVDLIAGCENGNDGETDKRSLKYYKLSEEINLGENAVLTLKQMGEVPFNDEPPSLYMCDELQFYQFFEFHPNAYGYLENDVILRIQASQNAEIKEMRDHLLIFLKSWQADAPKLFFPDADCLN